ncbi:serine/threonine-protein phosphatase [Arthrobacter sp. CAU 1506]|nr:protein phosphatase 2C domain-containing protein [Arthrobacter sp. CAU 1506]TJY70200.1 serine/threonine-protein phosphatase [Arthrobacter sp. CAU 1506]
MTRSKNDDSAYAGRFLAVVADGMGGHAGGDVASASTVLDLVHLDRAGHQDPATVLADEIQTANSILSELVQTNPKLAGMGTTVTALLLHDDKLEFAHIGDSRAYRLKNGIFEQVSVDHTFVQRLIDEGRLRPEEAEIHPHRNVLMRVLGDVDASPELDLASHSAEPGEKWLLCSDGLNAVVPDRVVESVVRNAATLQDAVDQLVDLTLDGGSPDNVTIVMIEVAEAPSEAADTASLNLAAERPLEPAAADGGAPPAATAPAAAAGMSPDGTAEGVSGTETPAEPHEAIRADAIRRELGTRPHVLVGAAALATETGQIPIVTAHSNKRRAAALLTHKAPEEPDASEVEAAAPLRKPWLIPAFLTVMSLLLVAVLWFGYLWTQTQYFVGASDGRVAIFNGVSQNFGPIDLSHVDTVYNIPLESLPVYQQQRLNSSISARDLVHAEQIVEQLRISSQRNCPEPGPSPSALPTDRPSGSATPSPAASPEAALPPECVGG